MKKPRLQHNHIFRLNNDTNDKNAGDDDNDNVKYLDAVNKNDLMILGSCPDTDIGPLHGVVNRYYDVDFFIL